MSYLDDNIRSASYTSSWYTSHHSTPRLPGQILIISHRLPAELSLRDVSELSAAAKPGVALDKGSTASLYDCSFSSDCSRYGDGV